MTAERATPRAAALIRVSTSKQDTESQRFAIERWARSSGHVVDWYDEGGVSGTKNGRERPNLARLLDDCAKGRVRFVVMTELSRLSRGDMLASMNLVVELCRSGVKVLAVNDGDTFDPDNPDSKLKLAFQAWFAERERRRIVIRSKIGQDAAREAARLAGRPHYIGAPGLIWRLSNRKELLRLLRAGATPRGIAKSKELIVFRRIGQRTPAGKRVWDERPVAVSEGAIYRQLGILGLDSHGQRTRARTP